MEQLVSLGNEKHETKWAVSGIGNNNGSPLKHIGLGERVAHAQVVVMKFTLYWSPASSLMCSQASLGRVSPGTTVIQWVPGEHRTCV